jgi:small redox-active disulfide protein 2
MWPPVSLEHKVGREGRDEPAGREVTMLIQVLGSGCAKCKKTAEHAQQAVAESGSDALIEKIEQIERIMAFGVMTTPALVIDGQVRIAGRVPSVEEIKNFIAAAAMGDTGEGDRA